jgi:hypothetical protein
VFRAKKAVEGLPPVVPVTCGQGRRSAMSERRMQRRAEIPTSCRQCRPRAFANRSSCRCSAMVGRRRPERVSLAGDVLPAVSQRAPVRCGSTRVR